MENGVVCVDYAGGVLSGGGGGGEGCEGGFVPVFVSWEDGGFGIVVDLDYEGFGERGGHKEEEGEGEERESEEGGWRDCHLRWLGLGLACWLCI